MATVHFTIMPGELNKANGHMRGPSGDDIFMKFVPVLTTMCLLGVKFLYLFCAF